jgi:hypothetical protein
MYRIHGNFPSSATFGNFWWKNNAVVVAMSSAIFSIYVIITQDKIKFHQSEQVAKWEKNSPGETFHGIVS